MKEHHHPGPADTVTHDLSESAPPSGEDMRHLDGNAAGGLLRELFALDLTSANATCAACGSSGALGALLAYGHRMGMVLRCPHCQGAVLRVTHTDRAYFLDLTGARVMRIAASA